MGAGRDVTVTVERAGCVTLQRGDMCHESGPHKATRAHGGGRFSRRARGCLRGDLAERAVGRVAVGPAEICVAARGGGGPRGGSWRWSGCPPPGARGGHMCVIDDTLSGHPADAPGGWVQGGAGDDREPGSQGSGAGIGIQPLPHGLRNVGRLGWASTTWSMMGPPLSSRQWGRSGTSTTSVPLRSWALDLPRIPACSSLSHSSLASGYPRTISGIPSGVIMRSPDEC